MTPADLRAAFEQGLRDDKCVMVLPQDGLDLLDEIVRLQGIIDRTWSTVSDGVRPLLK